MNSIKLIIFLFIILLTPFFSSALTYEELLGSYNYGYNIGTVNISNTSINDCDKCNNLSVTLSLINEPGNYEIYGFFDNKTSYLTQYLFDERSSVTLIFFPPFQAESNILWVRIIKDGTLVYFSNVSDIDISNTDFRTAKVNVINESEENGFLNILLGIDTPVPGNYLVIGYLISGENIIAVKQNENINFKKEINLIFDPRIDGNFTLAKVELNQSIFNIGYKTNTYSFSRIRFFNDTIIDGNLVLAINNTNNLSSNFYLFDVFSDYIASVNTSGNVVVFNGSIINSSGINGPYIIKAYVEEKTYTYTTGYYNYSDFQKIIIKDVEITVKISNAAKSIIKSISGFLSSKNKTENLNAFFNDTHLLEDEVRNFENSETIMEKSEQTKKGDGAQNLEVKNSFLQNLLTGNAVSEGSEEGYQGKKYLAYTLLLILTLVSIIGVSVFIRNRNH